MADKAPEAEALAGRLINRYRPVWTSVYSARRRLATIGVVVFTAWLFLHVTFGANGMVVYRQKRAEYQALQKANDALRQENELYLKHIGSLKTDPQTFGVELRTCNLLRLGDSVKHVLRGRCLPLGKKHKSAAVGRETIKENWICGNCSWFVWLYAWSS